VIGCRGFQWGGTVGVVVCLFISHSPSFMLVCPDENDESNEPFLTVVAFVVLSNSNRLMEKDPLGGESTVEQMFPADGGLLLDYMSKVFGKVS